MKTTGCIFNIQHFSLDDGPGIRTTVFLKGCPLDCIWCHNPESKAVYPELSFASDKCLMCGKCVSVCSEKLHSIEEDVHILHRAGCKKCGKCMDICYAGALTLIGKEYSVDEVMTDVQKDAVFFGSDGGLTLSGGEPLLQYDFSLELLKCAKANGIHTAIETCGYTTKDLADIIPYVDIWLYDIKLIDKDIHKKHTGVSNELILKNLKRLDALGGKIILRCPIIPHINLNETHFIGLISLAKELKNIIAIQLQPYHPLGISKENQLGKPSRYNNKSFLDKDRLADYAGLIKSSVNVEVTIN